MESELGKILNWRIVSFSIHELQIGHTLKEVEVEWQEKEFSELHFKDIHTGRGPVLMKG